MIIDLHHAETAELRQREHDVREQFSGQDVEIFSTCSRNEFLARIAGHTELDPSIALIDLRSETGDIEQSGLRIARTISRHPRLRSRSSVAVWTEHVSNANVYEVRRSGAVGLISDYWVDESGKHVLEDAISRIHGAEPGQYLVFPPRETNSIGAADPEDTVRNEAFARWFGFEPTELHFLLLWGIANAVELELLKEYTLEIGATSSTSAAKRQLEKLQNAMRMDIDTLGRPESGNPEIARRFLAELMPPDFDPLAELDWPRLSTVQELLLSDETVVECAFVDDEALDMLTAFLGELPPIERGRRIKGSEIYKSIETAIESVANIFDQPEAVTFNTIHHAAQSIDDAYWDLRRHGNPRESVRSG